MIQRLTAIERDFRSGIAGRVSGGKMKKVLVFLVFSLILLASAFAQA